MWEPVFKEEDTDEGAEMVPSVVDLRRIYGITEEDWGEGWPQEKLTMSYVPRSMIRSDRSVEFVRSIVGKKDVKGKDESTKNGQWERGSYVRGAVK